jgi:hypothetical protein
MTTVHKHALKPRRHFVSRNAFNSLPFCCALEIGALKPEDTMLIYGALGNFSLSGFELVLTRYVSTYIITYYLPSGTHFFYPIAYRNSLIGLLLTALAHFRLLSLSPLLPT